MPPSILDERPLRPIQGSIDTVAKFCVPGCGCAVSGNDWIGVTITNSGSTYTTDRCPRSTSVVTLQQLTFLIELPERRTRRVARQRHSVLRNAPVLLPCRTTIP